MTTQREVKKRPTRDEAFSIFITVTNLAREAGYSVGWYGSTTSEEGNDVDLILAPHHSASFSILVGKLVNWFDEVHVLHDNEQGSAFRSIEAVTSSGISIDMHVWRD
jgi:hypothetical protein